MDRTQSQNIVKDTFQNAFNKERFVYFVKNLLNKIDESKSFHAHGYIPEVYKDFIKTYERIGTYLSSDDKKIDILIVYLQKNISLERARTAQRNFVARYLKDRGEKDAGLIAFVTPELADWRFSLVKMDYQYEKSDKKIKIKEEFTPARRWSFLVGKNENSHTAQSRFAPIISDDINNPTLGELEEAFNIEKVTKEFFEKYRELFLWTKDELDKMVKKDVTIRKDFEEKNVDTADFAKKLLGQIVFLYFLQKKGWFGVNRDDNWGTGPKNFLRQLFEKKHEKYNNFFNDILEPLFYEALAKEREDDYYSKFNCKIPFLNGGLFDPINNYSWVHTDILMDNDLFSNEKVDPKTKDKGTGILDVFDRYNFTVKEDEPLEKEVAVDPEMLGKVFENLLQVKDRKSKGTYYTPREIVHYMCEQSLINYLSQELENDVSKKDIEKLIKYGETVAENEARVSGKGEETEVYSYKLPAGIRKNAKVIDNKLSNIKVCDPAIGSGAFPVGMMSEIVKARTTLNAYLCEQGKMFCYNRTPYDFKFECIQNSLYGVDIDPGAVEIAKLRLWLSLVVDEDDIKQIKPLPNLDYKIMQGNSLLEDLVIGDTVIEFNLDDLVKVDRRRKNMKNLFEAEKQVKLFKDKSEDIFSELRKLHSLFFEENNKTKKLQLKQRIDEKEESFIAARCEEEIEKLQSVINNTLDNKKIDKTKQQIKAIKSTLHNLKKQYIKPFFLWKLHFANVFQEKGGFDVIIANPPYVDSEAMTKGDQLHVRNAIQKQYKWTKGNWDIYIAFFEIGFRLMNMHGTLTFITPDKWIAKPFGAEFRKRTIYNIYLMIKAGRKIFENAKVDSIISFFASRKVNEINIINYENSKFILMRTIRKENISEPYTYDQLFSNHLELIVKIDKFENKLINFGVCEGACATSDAYKLKPLIKNSSHERIDNNKYFKIINTGTIGKYFSKWGKKDMTYLGHKYLFPIINKGRFTSDFPNSYGQKVLKPKIIIKGLNLLDACLDEHGLIVPGKSTLIISNNNINVLKFLLAIINSSLSFFYIKEKYPAASYNQGTSFTKDMINNLPIPTVGKIDQTKIIQLVDRILLITKFHNILTNISEQVKVEEYEKRIDQILYRLYGLNEEKIKIVEEK